MPRQMRRAVHPAACGRAITRIAVVLVLLVSAACSQKQTLAPATGPKDSVDSATPPFQTKEPERYSATRTITTVNAAGETTMTTTRIARDSALRRYEFELGPQRVVHLILAEGAYVLLPEQKNYAELADRNSAITPGFETESDSSPDRLLHTEPTTTTYQRLGPEDIRERPAQKYRVVVNSSTGENVGDSESLIWIDEALHMPVRSEITSRDGQRVLMELKDLVLEADRSNFQIPGGYVKITTSELNKRLRAKE